MGKREREEQRGPQGERIHQPAIGHSGADEERKGGGGRTRTGRGQGAGERADEKAL